MARDYKAEHKKAVENGYYDKRKKYTLTLTLEDNALFEKLLKENDCETLGQFIRKIIHGELVIEESWNI